MRRNRLVFASSFSAIALTTKVRSARSSRRIQRRARQTIVGAAPSDVRPAKRVEPIRGYVLRSADRDVLVMVRKRPMPFPPEPIASVGMNLTRWSLDRADRREGQRNLFLRTLDAIGHGFDS